MSLAFFSRDNDGRKCLAMMTINILTRNANESATRANKSVKLPQQKFNVIVIQSQKSEKKTRGEIKTELSVGSFPFSFLSTAKNAQYKNDLFYIMNKEVTMHTQS